VVFVDAQFHGLTGEAGDLFAGGGLPGAGDDPLPGLVQADGRIRRHRGGRAGRREGAALLAGDGRQLGGQAALQGAGDELAGGVEQFEHRHRVPAGFPFGDVALVVDPEPGRQEGPGGAGRFHDAQLVGQADGAEVGLGAEQPRAGVGQILQHGVDPGDQRARLRGFQGGEAGAFLPPVRLGEPGEQRRAQARAAGLLLGVGVAPAQASRFGPHLVPHGDGADIRRDGQQKLRGFSDHFPLGVAPVVPRAGDAAVQVRGRGDGGAGGGGEPERADTHRLAAFIADAVADDADLVAEPLPFEEVVDGHQAASAGQAAAAAHAAHPGTGRSPSRCRP
jgi:hypothetical protein